MKEKIILIIEDDLDIIEVLRELFELEGYKVYTFINGLLGLEWLIKSQIIPFLILVDAMMPVMTGIEFRVEQLKLNQIKDIPAILMTADHSMNHQNNKNFSEFLKKPFRLENILFIVSKYLK